MKKIIKKIGKNLIIICVIFMMLLSNISYAGYTAQEVGEAAANFAEALMTENTTSAYGGNGKLQYSQDQRNQNPFWNTSVYNTYINSSVWYFDCSSFATACYNYVTQEILLGESSWPATTQTIASSSNFEYIGSYSSNPSLAQKGDLICNPDTHVEIYISAELGSGGAHGSSSGVSINGSGAVAPSNGGIYRIKESVAAELTFLDSTFTSASSSSSSSSSVNFSNFYFNGIPDGKYSLAHTSIWTKIIETLAQIADYLIGILTYLFRIPFIGWTAIIENLLNWTVNTVTDISTEVEDMGINSVEVEGSDDETRLTVDKLLYNKYPLTDINIFEINT